MGNSGTFEALEHLGGSFAGNEGDTNVDPVAAGEVPGEEEGTGDSKGCHPTVANPGLAREEGIDDWFHSSRQGCLRRALIWSSGTPI